MPEVGQRLEIVSSHFREDLSWLRAAPWPVHVYTKIGGASPAIPPTAVLPNIGNEASAYLAYIVDRYHTLPEFAAFIHGHETAWHQRGGAILPLIENAVATGADFTSLNHTAGGPWCTDPSCKGRHHCDLMANGQWDALFARVLGPMPAVLQGDCCAQFVVARRILQRFPRSVYRSWKDSVLAYKGDLREPGFFFEYTWHYIFGEAAVPGGTSAPLLLQNPTVVVAWNGNSGLDGFAASVWPVVVVVPPGAGARALRQFSRTVEFAQYTPKNPLCAWLHFISEEYHALPDWVVFADGTDATILDAVQRTASARSCPWLQRHETGFFASRDAILAHPLSEYRRWLGNGRSSTTTVNVWTVLSNLFGSALFRPGKPGPVLSVSSFLAPTGL